MGAGLAIAARGGSLRIWGAGSFDNEAAMTWVEGLEDTDDLGHVEEALDEVLQMDDVGDIPPSGSAARAIAAAETVAALSQKPAESLPEEVRQWCFDNTNHDLAEAQPKALQALGVILQESALRDAFEDPCTAEDWETEIEDLRDRLRGA